MADGVEWSSLLKDGSLLPFDDKSKEMKRKRVREPIHFKIINCTCEYLYVTVHASMHHKYIMYMYMYMYM